MKAMVYDRFGADPRIEVVPDPSPPPDGVVVAVKATGLCRSDWHGWKGHDPDIGLPHVPGHEFAGTIAAAGPLVTRFRVGDRVTAPFVCGCGTCPECQVGDHQVCRNQTQPGFSHWGSFAEFVMIHKADTNLVQLPEEMSYAAAASLGCRFVTSFRAVIDQGRVRPGEWVAVHGCGGVGLSAIMIARAAGARAVAIDIGEEKLALARALGAEVAIDAKTSNDVAGAVVAATGGGAHLSLDALGHPTTLVNSVLGLRRRGRHVQIGLLLAEHAQSPVPMDRVVGYELELYGSHGMQAHRYGAMLDLIQSGRLQPEKLLGREISLTEAVTALTEMDWATSPGVTVITSF